MCLKIFKSILDLFDFLNLHYAIYHFYFLFSIYFISALFTKQKEIFLEDIFVKNTFKQDAVAGFRSMQDGRYYTEINGEGVLQKVNFETGKIESNILNLKDVKYNNKALKIDDYTFNNNETKLLLFTESENIYRRSVLHKVYVYDLNTQKIEQIKNEKYYILIFHPKVIK